MSNSLQRMEKFKSLAKHPFLKKDYAKLKPEEHAFCVAFLAISDGLTDEEFAKSVNRLGLNGELKEFKNPSLIWAMLSQSIEVQIRRSSK